MPRSSGSALARAIALVAVVAVSVGTACGDPAAARADGNWATSRAEELCAQGQSHRAGGEVDVALDRFRQAIEIDPTFGPAYLALGGLREATGDVDEAERTYAAGIDHVAGFADGLLARAALRLRAGRGDAALADFLAALALRATDIDVARRVRDASISLGRFPLALATSRRLVSLSAAQGDVATEHEARVTASALSELVGFADPVVDGEGRNPVRAALARSAAPHKRRPSPARPALGSARQAATARTKEARVESR